MPDNDETTLVPDLEDDLDVSLASAKEQEKKIKAAVTSSMSTIKDASAFVPSVRVVDTPNNTKVVYTRDVEPRCRLCKHAIRDDAEEHFIHHNYVVRQTLLWLIENTGEKWEWEQVAAHMRRHCDFKDPMINWTSKLQSRSEEVDAIMADPFDFFMRSLSVQYLELAEFDTSRDHARAKNLGGIKNQTAAEFAKMWELKNRNIGPVEQAEAMVARNNQKTRQMMKAIMSVVTDEQKQEILRIVSEFSQEEE
jgi:hypothetical protein